MASTQPPAPAQPKELQSDPLRKMAQQIPLTFSEVLNLPSLGVSANAIKFGVRDPSHP